MWKKIAFGVSFTLFTCLLFYSVGIGSPQVWEYEHGCIRSFRRAVVATTPEAVDVELGAVLQYLERRGLTHGYTSILYRSEEDDIGAWYGRMRSARAVVRALPPSAPQAERTQAVLRSREILSGSRNSGVIALKPPGGVGMYPYNRIVGLTLWGSLIVGAYLLITERSRLFK